MSQHSSFPLFLFVAIIFLGTVKAPAQSSTATVRMSRARAVRGLKGCARRPVRFGCSEETAEYVIRLYEHGDRALLGQLLDAGLHSDGALSEVLGVFYGDVLLKHPRLFLGALSSRPRRQQRVLSFLAGGGDGSGMGHDQLVVVRASMLRISSEHNTRLSSAARICLAEVEKANAKNKA